MVLLLQRFCPFCFRANANSTCVQVSPEDPRICAKQVECAFNTPSLRCLDLSAIGDPCGNVTCQITCLVCGVAIVTADEPDFAKIAKKNPEAMARNYAVLTELWPNFPVHASCCGTITETMNEEMPDGLVAVRMSKAEYYGSKTNSIAMPKPVVASEESMPKPENWNEVMSKMLPAPDKKPKAEPKKRPASKPAPVKHGKSARTNSPPRRGQEFDINHHGYIRVKGNVYFRTPDGVLHPCTGVDEFGPFKLAADTYFRKN